MAAVHLRPSPGRRTIIRDANQTSVRRGQLVTLLHAPFSPYLVNCNKMNREPFNEQFLQRLD
jgi:hypothetical protein